MADGVAGEGVVGLGPAKSLSFICSAQSDGNARLFNLKYSQNNQPCTAGSFLHYTHALFLQYNNMSRGLRKIDLVDYLICSSKVVVANVKILNGA